MTAGHRRATESPYCCQHQGNSPQSGSAHPEVTSSRRWPVAAPSAQQADPPASCPRPGGGLLVLVVAAPPRLRERQAVLVTPLRRPVEQLVDAIQDVGAACVGRVGVVDDAVLEREGAEPVRLLARVVDPAEVVLCAVGLLLLREGDAEVEVEVASQ